jgi:hypothetical protein
MPDVRFFSFCVHPLLNRIYKNTQCEDMHSPAVPGLVTPTSTGRPSGKLVIVDKGIVRYLNSLLE